MRRLKPSLRMMAFALGIGAIAVGAEMACGGSSSSSPIDTPGHSDAGSEATTTADSAGGEAPYTLDDVCERTPPLICETRKSCCESGPGFDEAACLAHAKAECEKDVAEVRAGRAAFHPERIPECLRKYRAVLQSCTLTFELLQKHARDIASCEAITGQLDEGEACERTSQCKPATGEGEIVGCDDDTKKCKITRIVPEGAPCTIGPGLPNLCDEGLYCDADLSSQPFTGVCKKKTSLGVACDKDEPFALECGLGNYCDKATGVCTVGKAGGAPCATDLECASVTCEKPDGGASGTCKPLRRIVKDEECKGP